MCFCLSPREIINISALQLSSNAGYRTVFDSNFLLKVSFVPGTRAWKFDKERVYNVRYIHISYNLYSKYKNCHIYCMHSYR